MIRAELLGLLMPSLSDSISDPDTAGLSVPSRASAARGKAEMRRPAAGHPGTMVTEGGVGATVAGFLFFLTTCQSPRVYYSCARFLETRRSGIKEEGLRTPQKSRENGDFTEMSIGRETLVVKQGQRTGLILPS